MKIKIAGNESGVVLLIVLVVIVVVSITLPAYMTWTIWEQRSLMRRQSIDYAHLLAQAGLNRALLDLRLDDTWTDGRINLTDVTPPDDNPAEDNLFLLYDDTITFSEGSYRVDIRYLYDAGGSVYERMIWVRSTGTVTGGTFTGTTSTLEQLVSRYPVKNIGQDRDDPSDDGEFYISLTSAIGGADLDADDTIAISDARLNETVTISLGPHFYIRGCYDFDFINRDCTQFRSVINGNINVTGGADVDIGGVTIN